MNKYLPNDPRIGCMYYQLTWWSELKWVLT
jgi:hypothetical protein